MTEYKQIHSTAFQHSPIGMLVVDQQGDILTANNKATSLFEYTIEELLHNNIDLLAPPGIEPNQERRLENVIATQREVAINTGRTVKILRKSGTIISLQIGLTAIAAANASYTLISILEISDHAIQLANLYDPLTNLANRNLFVELCENLINLSFRTCKSMAMVYIDIDKLQTFNALHGRQTGDKLLLMIADILRSSTRKNDVAARMGGDELTVFLYDVKTRQDVMKVVNKITQHIYHINRIGDAAVNIAASIGVIHSPADSKPPVQKLINMAHGLMCEAKRSHSTKTVFSSLED